MWVVCVKAVSNAMLLNAGNTSQYAGLVHAALSEHSMVTGGSFGPCCGGDALPIRPFQVKEALRLLQYIAGHAVLMRLNMYTIWPKVMYVVT